MSEIKTPIIVERFADNGEFSHYELVDTLTGETLWPCEQLEKENAELKKNVSYWKDPVITCGGTIGTLRHELDQLKGIVKKVPVV